MGDTFPFIIVDQSASLQSALKTLTAHTTLALDLEMENSYRRYGLHIALIQISTADNQHYIFDPLSQIDLTPLGHLLTHPRTELIMHDADFDRQACQKIYNWKLRHIFDTKIAAQLAGYRRFGLSSLLMELFAIQTNKKFQTFNWLTRPLPADALSYAVNDTASLHRLKDHLVRRLTAQGRLDWAEEEFSRQESKPMDEPLPPAHFRIKNSATLTPRQLAVLKSLVAFRDRLARRLNRPVHYIVRDSILIQWAVQPPPDIQTWQGIRGLHPALRQPSAFQAFQRAVAQGRATPPEQHPACVKHARRQSQPGHQQRLLAMKAWRTQLAAELDLEPHLILDSRILNWHARFPEETMPADIAGQLRQWQKDQIWPIFEEKFPVATKQDATFLFN